MTAASGIFKQLAMKLESSYGVAPSQAAAQQLRRIQSTVDLNKDTYESKEIRPDFQVANFRHGVRRVSGSVNCELSPGTYKDLFSVACKRDFAAVTSITGLSLTISGTGPYIVARSAGDFLTSGIKIGTVTRLSGGSLNAANASKNLLVIGLTSLQATVIVLNGSALVAEGPIASCTMAVPGKTTYVPTTGHTDKSFALEHWHADIAQSELFLGCKVGKFAVDLPPTGISTVTFDVIGKDFADTTAKRGAVALNAQYFTSPTAVTTTDTLTAVNGVLIVGGAVVASLTGLKFELTPKYSGDPVVGSNTVPNQFAGPVMVKGEFTAYFENATFRDAFVQETEVDIAAALTSDNTDAADFLAFYMPRIKLGGSSKNDGDSGLIQTVPFTALLSRTGGSGFATEKTTFMTQDSQA